MFKNRLTLGYFVLVGLPLLFLMGTLRAGRSLAAPPAISGEWTVQPLDAVQDVAGWPAALTIYQTGADLLITLHDPAKTQFSARLERGQVAGAHGFTARIVSRQGLRILEGTISSVRFTAARAGRSEKG